MSDVIKADRDLVDNVALLRQVEALKALNLPTYITNDVDTKRMLGDVLLVSGHKYPNVLVTGPTGTGKEIIAKLLHGTSVGKLVTVNCAGIPEGLFESELFGHVKGAFTGADSSRPGALETARGGTIFLDEIQDLPLAQQAKLLRVLSTGSYCRVGSDTPTVVDVRVVAATNKPLNEAHLRKGLFRDDLYWRIAQIVLTTRSLAERRCDIIPIAEHIIEVNDWTPLTEEDKEIFLSRDYASGNVRELYAYLCRREYLG